MQASTRFVRACAVSASLFAFGGTAACADVTSEESIGRDDSYVVEGRATTKVDGGVADGGDSGAFARYAAVSGLRDDALKAGLYALVKGHRSLGYDKARDMILGGGGRTGIGLVGSKLECVYTGAVVSPDGSREPNGFNTEHSWPQSMGAQREPARSDLHHLFPVDARANSYRGNNPFGEVGCLHGGGTSCNFSSNGSGLGRDADGKLAFEVRNEKRGDIARAHFYFAVRYDIAIGPDEEATLRTWNTDDPVDAYERSRNDEIDALQRNRNPFIDRPDLVALISDF